MVSKITANHLFPVALLFVVCIALYLNSLSNGFVFDDYAVIIENKHIQHPLESFPSFFNHSYFSVAAGESSYRPVATLSYYSIYAVAGLNPFWYHLFSLFLHAANVILIYLLAGLILKNRLTALIAAVLFACHPALTEAVDCISYNEDLLAAFFYILALIFYLRLRSTEPNPSIKYYTLSLFFFLLGLFSKEMAITLPAIILLYDVSFRDEADQQSFSFKLIINTIKDRGLVYSGFMAVGLFYLFVRFFLLVNPEHSLKPFSGSLLDRIIFLPAHIFSFIKLSFWPVKLTADYVVPYPPHYFSISNFIGVLCVAGLVVPSFFIFRHSRKFFFATWWFLITLFPVYNLIPIYNPLAERYLYLPLIGFCMAPALGVNFLKSKQFFRKAPANALLPMAIVAILSFYSAGTIARNRDWKDSLTLWSKTALTSPDSSTAHGSLGRAYQDRGQLKKAIREYEKAIEIFPDNYKAYYNLGVIYDLQGALKEAETNYKSAIDINPAFVNARFNLGNIYHKQGLLSEAMHQYRTVTELDPADFEARNNLGVAYAAQGKLKQAMAEWKKVLKMDPDNKSAADNINKAKKMLE